MVKVYSWESDNVAGIKDVNVTISVTEYYLAKAVADYNADDEELDVELKSDVRDLNENGDTLKLEDFPNIAGVKKGEYLVVTIAKTDDDYDIKTVAPAELIENVTVTSARADDYVMAGEKYVYSDISKKEDSGALGQGLMAGDNDYDLKGNGYNLYLDPNDYVLGVESYDGGVNMGNYLFIKDVSNSGFDIIAKAVFSDGTSKTINVTKLNDDDVDDKLDITADKFYKFSVSGDNYKLTTVSDDSNDDVKVIQGNVEDKTVESKLNPIEDDSTNYANDDTLFVAKDKATTGVKNAPKVNSDSPDKVNDVYYLIGNEESNENLLLWVYCTQAGSVTTSVEDLVYILNAKAAVGKDDNGDIYTYTVWQNGKKVELDTNSADKAVGLYEVDTYTDGRADLDDPITASVANKFVYKSGIAKYSFSGSVLSVDSDRYRLTDDVKVYTIDEETVKTVSPSSLGQKTVDDEFTTAILVREEDDAKADVAVVYVVKGAGAGVPSTDATVASATAVSSNAGVSATCAVESATIRLTVTGSPSDGDTLTVTATPTDANASVSGDATLTYATATTSWSTGTITVTAEDGTTTKTYTVTTEAAPAATARITSTLPASIGVGDTLTAAQKLTVNVSNGTAASYKWQESDTENGTYSDVVGGTNVDYVPSTAAALDKWYQCVVTLDDGSTVTTGKEHVEVKEYATAPTVAFAFGSGNTAVTLTDKAGTAATTTGDEVKVTVTSTQTIAVAVTKGTGLTGTEVATPSVTTGTPTTVYTSATGDNGTLTVEVTISESGKLDLVETYTITVTAS